MKKILFLLPLIAFLVSSCDIPTTQSAMKYNDDMLYIQQSVDDQMASFIDNAEHYNRAQADQKIEEMSKSIDDAIETVKNKKDFDGKDDFKKAMIKLLEAYKDLLHKEFYLLFVEYASYIEFSDEELELYELVYYDFMNKYESAHEDFNNFQKSFADKWNFTIGG